MNKQLIYKDITKVLYMMKNHGIRFQYKYPYEGAEWETIEDVEDFRPESADNGAYLASYDIYDGCEFRVHPDDVAKFDPAENDVVSFGTEGLVISSRDGKAWLSPDPDEVRDE